MTDIGLLVERARIVRAIRSFFDERGFVEVETAVRITAPAPEEHIDCPPCRDGGYLRASPELQMKKLLAAGMDRIYQIGPCFREGERGSRHSPEFTMLEWYRGNATYREIADDLTELLTHLVELAGRRGDASDAIDRGDASARSDVGGSRPSRHSRPSCRDCLETTTLSVRDAYLRFAGWDPWAGDWDQDRFDFDMATKIEPAIKDIGGGVFLVDYPPQAASLAKISKTTNFLSDFFPNHRGLSPNRRGLSPNHRGLSPAIGGLSPATSRGLSPATSRGLSPATSRGLSPATSRGLSPATSRGLSPATSRGLSPDSRGLSPAVAERWEFYWDGMELANCFTELCDEAEQRARFMAAKAARAALGESDYPIDEEFLASLPRIGSAAGVALGVDRLVMKLVGAADIASVRAPV